MYKYLMSVQYDGTEYSGFVKQIQGINTVYDKLENAISLICKNNDFNLTYASRTDAGTHAKDQKCLLTLPFLIKNTQSFIFTLNDILPVSIYVNSICLQNDNFEIQSYQYKIYKYRINLSSDYDVFLSRQELKINKLNFNFKKFKKSLKLFQGRHNFINFCKLDDINKNTVREIENILITKTNHGNILTISFKSRGFLRYQIRYIIGTCLSYSQNKITYNKISELLNSDVKKTNKFKAPSKGLTLYKISY